MAAGGKGNAQGGGGDYGGRDRGMGGGRKADGPPHAGSGGGAVAGLGNMGGFGGRNNGKNNPFDSRLNNSRYSQSTGVARPGTMGNIATALGSALPGGSMLMGGRSLINGSMDPYSGPSMPHTNFGYDSPNHASPLAMSPSAYQQQMAQIQRPKPPQQIMPQMSQAAPQQFGYKPFGSQPGMSWARPGYTFRGPGQ